MDKKVITRTNNHQNTPFNKASLIPEEKFRRENRRPIVSETKEIKEEETEETVKNIPVQGEVNAPNQKLDVKDMETELIKRMTKIPKFPIFMFIFPLLLALLIPTMMSMKYSDGINWAQDKEPIKGISKVYEIIDEVGEEYLDSYNLEIDKSLIVATISALKMPDAYDDKSDEKKEKEEVDEEGFENTSYSKLENMVNILAAYQIMRETKCNYPSNTMREIAFNDKSGVENFWEEEADNERNFNCSNSFEEMNYVLSTEQGNLNNDNSGSVYYWNLIDGDFLEEYYSEIFKNIKFEEYEIKKDNLIKEIYNYKKVLDKEKENK